MGQHKTNQNSILKKQGKLEPKKKSTLTKQERDSLLKNAMNKVMHEHGLLSFDDMHSFISTGGEKVYHEEI